MSTSRTFMARGSAFAIALARIALGAIATARPEPATEAWAGPELAGRRAGRLLGRALGARDVAIGAGTALALIGPDRRTARALVAMGAAADAVDAAATVLAWPELPARSRPVVLAAAAGSAALGVWAVGRLSPR